MKISNMEQYFGNEEKVTEIDVHGFLRDDLELLEDAVFSHRDPQFKLTGAPVDIKEGSSNIRRLLDFIRWDLSESEQLKMREELGIKTWVFSSFSEDNPPPKSGWLEQINLGLDLRSKDRNGNTLAFWAESYGNERALDLITRRYDHLVEDSPNKEKEIDISEFMGMVSRNKDKIYSIRNIMIRNIRLSTFSSGPAEVGISEQEKTTYNESAKILGKIVDELDSFLKELSAKATLTYNDLLEYRGDLIRYKNGYESTYESQYEEKSVASASSSSSSSSTASPSAFGQVIRDFDEMLEEVELKIDEKERQFSPR